VLPSGKARASRCWHRTSGAILQNFATSKLTLCDLNQRPRYLTFVSKANSVPGSRQTATVFSAGEAKPAVAHPRKWVETRASPTLAGRDAMACRLNRTSDSAPLPEISNPARDGRHSIRAEFERQAKVLGFLKCRVFDTSRQLCLFQTMPFFCHHLGTVTGVKEGNPTSASGRCHL